MIGASRESVCLSFYVFLCIFFSTLSSFPLMDYSGPDNDLLGQYEGAEAIRFPRGGVGCLLFPGA